jgi:hypothetical protein
MNWFCRSESNKSETQGQSETLPLLRILALSGPPADQVFTWAGVPPVNLVGFIVNEESGACLVPTLARDGHVSLVFAASALDDFHRVKENVSARFAKRLNELRLSYLYLTNFLVVGLTLSLAEDPSKMFLVCHPLISPEPIPELADVYNRLSFVTDSKIASELERYFADDMRKRWVNKFIAMLERILNWPEFVADATRRIDSNPKPKNSPFIC